MPIDECSQSMHMLRVQLYMMSRPVAKVLADARMPWELTFTCPTVGQEFVFALLPSVRYSQFNSIQ